MLTYEELNQKLRGKIFYILYVLYAIFILGTAVSGWNWYDVQWFLKWVQYGPLYFYYAPKCAYFPLTPLTFIAFYKFAKLLVSTFHPRIPIYTIRLVTKLPVVVSVLLIAYILYRKAGPIPAIAWMFTFATYSNVWALQYDVVSGLLILLAGLCILKDRYLEAGACIAFATLYKQACIIAGLTLFLALLLTGRRKQALYAFIGLAVPLLALTLPYLILEPWQFIYKSLLFHAKRFPQDLSIWNIPQLLTDYHHMYKTFVWLWEYVFIGAYVAYMIFTVYFLRKNFDQRKLALVVAGSLVLLIAINKVGNPGYLLWSLPLLIMLVQEPLFYVMLAISSLFAYIVYPFLMYVPAVMLNKGVFIVEDLKYWPARKLFIKSIIGLPQSLEMYLTRPISLYEYKLMKFLYKNFGYFATVCAIMYNAFLGLALYYVLTRVRNLKHPNLETK